MPLNIAWFESQIASYENDYRPVFEEFAHTLQTVIRQAAHALGIEAIVEARPKAIPSFAEKIIRKPRPDPVRQFTDLCGARAIVYRKDHIEPLCAFVRAHFEIDWANSEDVLERLKPGEFGYRSVHFIVSFRPGSGLPDIPERLLARYSEAERDQLGYVGPKYKAEIQIRTLMQHNWAMLIHDTFYKSGFEVPRHLRRDAGRIAALLEDADDAFARLMQDINAYRAHLGAYMSPAQLRGELEILRQVHRHDPDNADLACRIARLLLKLEDWTAASELLAPLEQRELARAQRYLGIARQRQGITGLENLERAARLDPTNTDVLCTLANSYAEAGDTEKALDCYQRAFQLAPTEPRVLRGYLEHRIGRDGRAGFLALLTPHLEAAIQICQQRARVGLEIPWVYFDGGFFALLLGRTYEALNAFAKALRHSFTEARIEDFRARLESLQKALRAAATATLRQAGQQTPSLQERIDTAVQTLQTGSNLGLPPRELLGEIALQREHLNELELGFRLIGALECVRRLLLLGTVGKRIDRLAEATADVELRDREQAEAEAEVEALAAEVATDAASAAAVERAREARNGAVERLESARQTLTACQERLTAARAALLPLAERDANGGSRGFAEPVVIVAGGCDESVLGDLDNYRALLVAAFQAFQGTVISGGTTAGIPGLVGDLLGSLHKVAYLPEPLPADSERHDGYREVHRTPGLEGNFSPLEPLQYWMDLLAAGLPPARVKLFGINGGPLAGFEYQLALALGAKVAVLRDSGRAVKELIKDPDWCDAPHLALLPFDWASARAFVQFGAPASFAPDLRERLAQGKHKHFQAEHRQRFLQQEPAMTDWEKLPQSLKDSNLEAVDYLERLLQAGGLKLRKATGDTLTPLALSAEQIEIMAELEHGRWVVERLLAGWRQGSRAPEQRTSPYLVAWADLTDDVRQWDRDSVATLPRLLATHGYEVY